MFYFNDDHYLNLVSGVAFSCCAVFKVVFGSFFDWYRWETLNFTFIVTEILIILIGPLFWSNKILFLVWVSAGLSVSGINFISILVLTDRLYPKDKWVMSFVAISFILDMILVNFYMGVLVPWLGYFWVFYSLLGFQAIAFALGVYTPYLAKPYKEELLLSS
jgi:MFS family permease